MVCCLMKIYINLSLSGRIGAKISGFLEKFLHFPKFGENDVIRKEFSYAAEGLRSPDLQISQSRSVRLHVGTL